MEKAKKIVVFGANGGIGQATAHALARQMDENNHQADVCLVTRAKEGRPNLGEGIAAEIQETFTESKVDLAQAFDNKHHVQWDDKHPEKMQELLRDADVVIVAAGEPRKIGADGRTPERSELIGPNADVVVPITEAVARYAPVNTPIIACTNPLDNEIGIMEETCRKVWNEEKHIPKEAQPAIKVVGMAGTLDEMRLKIFTAKAVNAALKENGHDASSRIKARDVDGRVYGQHGPAMVIDAASITIDRGDQKQPLAAFLDEMGLQDKKDAIIKDITDNTKSAGAKLLKSLGRTAQTAPGERLAELAMAALFSEKPYLVTASVVHDQGDSRPIASGCRVAISPAGIVAEPEQNASAELASQITQSRKDIIADQARFDALKPLSRASEITRTKEGEIVIRFGGAKLEEAASTGKLLEEALKLEPGEVKAQRGMSPSIAFNANGTLPVFEKLVAAAGKEIRESQLDRAG